MAYVYSIFYRKLNFVINIKLTFFFTLLNAMCAACNMPGRGGGGGYNAGYDFQKGVKANRKLVLTWLACPACCNKPEAWLALA